MCVIDAALQCGFIQSPPVSHSHPSSATGLPASSTSTAPELPDASAVAWGSAVPVVKRLLAASSEIDGGKTLADGLNSDLGKLASALGMAGCLEDIAISDLVSEQPLAEEVAESLAGLRESLAPLERAILEQRLLAPHPATLEELGQGAGLTRERIRQIEKAVESRLHHPSATGAAVKCWIGALAEQLRAQLGPITSRAGLEERISAAFPLNEDDSDSRRAAAEMARHLLKGEAGYSCADGVCVDPAAVDAISELTAQARSMADEVGLIDESDLKDRLADETWHRHWDQLLAQCGLHRFCGHLALRDTTKAKAKAALVAIGRPATREEVGELAGLAPGRLGAQLSAIPGVMRADKRRWGLAEWIEDEYEGIPAEIIQRIDEDGGATRMERLLEELPRLFEVSEGSVRSYASSPRFQISDGYVSLADPSSITLRPLDDAIDGRTADGLPYWGFRVEARYFDGYSLAGLPAEVAKALGCEPDRRVRVPVASPQGCGPVSVRWPLTSLTGASLGYLSAPLTKLEAQEGEQVLLVLGSSGSVSFHRDTPGLQGQQAAAPSEDDGHASERAKDLLERMKNRRRGL